MKKAVLMLGIMMLVFLLSCSHGWKHPTKPQDEWNDDYADCVTYAENESETQIGKKDRTLEFGREGKIRYFIQKCMEAKGYYQSEGAGGN